MLPHSLLEHLAAAPSWPAHLHGVAQEGDHGQAGVLDLRLAQLLRALAVVRGQVQGVERACGKGGAGGPGSGGGGNVQLCRSTDAVHAVLCTTHPHSIHAQVCVGT